MAVWTRLLDWRGFGQKIEPSHCTLKFQQRVTLLARFDGLTSQTQSANTWQRCNGDWERRTAAEMTRLTRVALCQVLDDRSRGRYRLLTTSL